MFKRFKSTMCRTSGHEWNNFRKLSERCGKCKGCGSREATLSVLETRGDSKCGF